MRRRRLALSAHYKVRLAKRSPSEDNGYPGSLRLAYNNSNADGVLSREQLRDFTTVCSETYSHLEEHYNRVYADCIVEEDVVG